MFKRSFFIAALLAVPTTLASAQAKYTATRTGDLQLGVDFSDVQTDYQPNRVKAIGFYGTFDVRSHLGAEIDFHQANGNNNDHLYERSYEVGARYFRTYGRFSPYARLMYGRGVFNFPYTSGGPIANLAYNMFDLGGGVDISITRYLNVRADYEYQHWFSFPPSGLAPQLGTIGVAYHFPGGLKHGLRFPGR